MPKPEKPKDNRFEYGDFGATMEEIAIEFGVTNSAASQMCAQAYIKFRKELIRRMIEKDDLL